MSEFSEKSNTDEMATAKITNENQEVIESQDAKAAHDEMKASQPVVENSVSVEEKLKVELTEAKDRLLRLMAEFENYKKIAQREQQNSIKFANENLVLNLLPVIDNLEQAIIACKKSGDANNSVLIGVEMVFKQLVDVLSKVGIELFSALNQPFDPARHEAMGEQEDASVETGTVITEYQKGYLFHGRLLRPARVVIAKKPKS